MARAPVLPGAILYARFPPEAGFQLYPDRSLSTQRGLCVRSKVAETAWKRWPYLRRSAVSGSLATSVASSNCASAISGISGVGAKPSSAGPSTV